MTAAAVVADTHILVWYVGGQALSQPAVLALDVVDRAPSSSNTGLSERKWGAGKDRGTNRQV